MVPGLETQKGVALHFTHLQRQLGAAGQERGSSICALEGPQGMGYTSACAQQGK